MAYSADEIIPVNVLLTPSGLGYANFGTAMVFADASDLADNVTFDAGDLRDYSGVNEVAEDFGTDSDIYRIATRWFANTPKPAGISVYMKAEDQSPIDAANASVEKGWRYHAFFKNSDITADTVTGLADWADATNHPIWITLTSADTISSSATDDIASILKDKGNRHVFVGYKDPDSVANDPSQAYWMVQLAAAFNKFNPQGTRTAITGEYQVLPGVSGDDLSPTAYSALKAKNVVFVTKIETAGEVDNSRVINSKSMSSYGEFIDDIVNIDVLRNQLQVDGYNYLANGGTKRALDELGFAGLLDAASQVGKRFYDNGVLGAGQYTNPETGDTETADFGYRVLTDVTEVNNLTTAQRRNREFPTVTMLIILARAGHTAQIDVTVQ
ncbi:hypothetical protein R84981_002894 [Carnimonas sp. R-84981]|uniref:DUF3383 family protein n=1 Tax=Carnimonas bestiolae TaxID=3402172 RepID=UPI003EDC1580